MAAIPLEQEIEYPTSDGQPMAETTLHRKVIADLIEALERHVADSPDVWVGGNLFLCYEKGNPEAARAPDVLLAKGVAKWDRPNYLLWEETPPSLIVEVTSRKTRREDQRDKKDIYERIGVEEYVLFDPYGDYLRPRLQGYRLEGGCYQPILPAADGSLESRTTGLTLRPEGERLRLVHTATGEPLLWTDELEGALQRSEATRVQAESRAAEAEARAVAAEARAAEEAAARRALEERLRALEREREQ
jgi:Uma2 family endonuclease